MQRATLISRLERLAPGRDRRRTLYALLAAVILFVVGEVVHPGFASIGSIEAVLTIASFVGLVAAGQTFVVLIGGIDLSVPWVLNGAAILLVTASLGQDGRAFYALLLTLGMGVGVGLLNGIGVAFLEVPAVVITLAMNGVMEGLTLGLSGGLTCQACASYAPPIVQKAVHGQIFGAPAELYLWLAIILAVSFVLSRTTFGRRTYAIGNNVRASYLAGISVTTTGRPHGTDTASLVFTDAWSWTGFVLVPAVAAAVVVAARRRWPQALLLPCSRSPRCLRPPTRRASQPWYR